MKEKLYTIPVNDAFKEDCECPLCAMRKTLEENAVTYTMGPSYMEDDVRAKTDELGFCAQHLKMLYENQNRLGLALILDTHLDKINKDLEKLFSASPKLSSPSLFKKKSEISNINEYIKKLNSSCFVCNKIETTFQYYIETIFHLYKTDSTFVEKFTHSKGLCINHYGLLYEQAQKHLSGKKLEDFILEINTLFLDNMKRVKEDLDWFIDKFDYRYADEPWKNSKDALPRTMLKINSMNL